MTPEALQVATRKQLAALAQSHGVEGWHSMRKDELYAALREISASRTRSAPRRGARANRRPATAPPVVAKLSPRPRAANRRTSRPASPTPTAVASTRRPEGLTPVRSPAAPRELGRASGGGLRDEFVLSALDAYWLHAEWMFTRQTLARAEAALGHDWHRAKPVLRLFELANSEESHAGETLVAEIPIHGGVNRWFVPAGGPGRTCRVQIGYLVPGGRFHTLAKSNTIATPRMSSEQDGETLNQILPASMNGMRPAPLRSQRREFFEASVPSPSRPATNLYSQPHAFQLEAELILHGTTRPSATVTIEGERVPVGEDGAFMLRMQLAEGRQVIPTVSVSADGREQRTIILAIDRNTKELAPESPEEL